MSIDKQGPDMAMLNEQYIDVSKADGTSERVKVRRLSVREVYRFVEFASEDKIPDLLCMITGRDEDWLNSLSDEGYSALAEVCIPLNFQRAQRMAKGDPILSMKVARILALAAATVRLANTASGSHSAVSSLVPALSPDGPAITPSIEPSMNSTTSSGNTQG